MGEWWWGGGRGQLRRWREREREREGGRRVGTESWGRWEERRGEERRIYRLEDNRGSFVQNINLYQPTSQLNMELRWIDESKLSAQRDEQISSCHPSFMSVSSSPPPRYTTADTPHGSRCLSSATSDWKASAVQLSRREQRHTERRSHKGRQKNYL